MSRIRTLKPEFFRSSSLARCSYAARLTFAGLWCEADDAGRGVADARILKGAIWSQDDDVTPDDVDDHLMELSGEHIVLYAVGNKRYFAVNNWEAHQAAAYRRAEAKYPAPPFSAAHQGVLEVEGKGREVDREAARVTDAPASSRKRRGTTAPAEFEITPELKEWATKHGYDLDLDHETQQFLDHHRAKGSVFTEWQSAWRTWMRNSDKWAKERKAKAPQQRQSQSNGMVTRTRKDVAMGDVRAYRDTGQMDLADELQAQIEAGEFD